MEIANNVLLNVIANNYINLSICHTFLEKRFLFDLSVVVVIVVEVVLVTLVIDVVDTGIELSVICNDDWDDGSCVMIRKDMVS